MDIELEEDIDNAFVGSSVQSLRYQDFIDISMDTRNTPVLWGPPGIGKTALINAVIKKRRMLLRTLIGSTMDPTDVAGLPVLKHLPDGTIITEFTMPDWFYEVSEYARKFPEYGACVFIDEITTASPPVQAALLTFIQDRRIGKFYLPDNVLIIAAGNPASQAADGWQLAPPTANRFAHIDFIPSKVDWFAGMRVAWNSKTVSDFELNHRSFIVAFLTNNTSLINKMPDDPEAAGLAWPSMRQWDNAARMLGRAKDKIMGEMVVKSCVGTEASDEYFKWLSQLQIPSYEDVISDPTSVAWASLRADELYMVLSIVIDNVNMGNLDDTFTVFRAAQVSRKPDVVSSLIIPFKKQAFVVYRQAGESTKKLPLAFAQLANEILTPLRRGRGA